MRTAVFDTNVYISALITRKGKAEQALLIALVGKIEVYTSIAILTEVAQKLREKFLWEDEQIKSAVRHIAKIAHVVKPNATIHFLSDEPDNRILECAQHVGVEFIVTGDRHLLDLVDFNGIKIIKISEFLKIIGGADSQ